MEIAVKNVLHMHKLLIKFYHCRLMVEVDDTEMDVSTFRRYYGHKKSLMAKNTKTYT